MTIKETLTLEDKRALMAHLTAIEEGALTLAERAEEAVWQARLVAKERADERLRQRIVRAAYQEAVWGTAA